jgi:amino acid transporter
VSGSGSHYKRSLGTIALTAVGLGSIIGSGWLFGAMKASVIAGPAAILAWVIGAVVALTIALSYTELGSMFPEAGGMVRFGQYSHGSLTGYLAAWANWIAIVSVIPGEATASIQYMSSWSFGWTHALYDKHSGQLSGTGVAAATALMLVYFALNWFAVSLFAKTNTAITVFKLVIPTVTIVGLLATAHHSGNLHSAGGFAPYGVSSVFTAVATSGIVWAFNGFQSPINMAAEARNPRRALPIAVLGSIGIALVVYIGLQIAYLLSVSPADLAAHGWKGFSFSSPFADLAGALMLNWLAVLLYADAFISPSGTGMTYAATTSRMIHGVQRNGHLPGVFGKVDPKTGVPRPALLLNLGVAFIFLAVFRGWGSLASVVSVATVISYVTGPVAVVALRRLAPGLPRPVRIKALPVVAPLAFVFGTLVLYWARWPLTGKVILIMAVGLPVYAYYELRHGTQLAKHLRSGAWLVGYLVWMALLSYAGGKEFGGRGWLPTGWDIAVVAASGLAFYFWGLASGWLNPTLAEVLRTGDHGEREAETLGGSAEGRAQATPNLH